MDQLRPRPDRGLDRFKIGHVDEGDVDAHPRQRIARQFGDAGIGDIGNDRMVPCPEL